MAERQQDAVEHTFATHEVNKAGIYMVLLYVNGLRTPIIVDDWIPCIDGKPCFACSEDENEIWCLLLEKAWAKLFGSYRRMEGGDPAFAASHLSGSPAWSVQTGPIRAAKKYDDFGSMLLFAEDRNYSIVCSGLNADDDGEGAEEGSEKMIEEEKDDKKKGADFGASFSVIGFYEFRSGKRERIKLVKIRNPWGTKLWDGEWSEHSPLWTPERRNECGATDMEGEKISIMPLQNFMDKFEVVSIWVDQDPDKYHHSNIIYDFDLTGFSMTQDFTFNLERDVVSEDVFCITASQQGDRLRRFRLERGKFEPVSITIQLLKDDKKVDEKTSNDFVNFLEVDNEDLKAGQYTIRIRVQQWNVSAYKDDKHKKICVDVYCE